MVQSPLRGAKRIFFDRIFERSYWTWRKHPAIIVPSMLGSAITVIEQSIFTTGAIIFVSLLANEGTLSAFLTQISSGGLTPSLLLNLLFSSSYTPLLIPILGVAVVAYLLTAILGGGFVYSSEYGIYLDAWNNDKATVGSVVRHGSVRWKAMVAGLIGLVASSILLDFTLIASLIIAIFTVYSYPAVVIDNVSGLRAIKNSFGAASHNLGATLSYSIVRVLLLIMLTVVVIPLTSSIGLPLSSVIAAILSLFLTPVLHSTKTMIYYYSKPNVSEMPFELSDPIWQDISRRLPRAAWTKIKAGLVEVGRFTIGPRNLPFHFLSVLAFGLGVSLGDYVSISGVKSSG